MIPDKETLRTHIANYASRCAEKLRKQDTVASIVGVFVSSNPFREDLLQYWKYDELRLITPTSSTIPIVQAGTGTSVIGQIDLQYDREQKKIVDFRWKCMPVNDRTAPKDLAMQESSDFGVGWARSGGECDAVCPEASMAVDGINKAVKAFTTYKEAQRLSTNVSDSKRKYDILSKVVV